MSDSLPFWVDSPTKKAIINFVNSVIKEGSIDYISPEERIATFDNDGTLCCEKPLAQLEFVSYQIKNMVKKNPQWNKVQPYKSILEGNKNYLVNDVLHNQGKELMKLMAVTHSGMTKE